MVKKTKTTTAISIVFSGLHNMDIYKTDDVIQLCVSTHRIAQNVI